MSNKTFDVLAFIQRLLLPSIATLIASLGEIWGWDVERIVLTITAVDAFMGYLLKYSSNQYFSPDDSLDWNGIEAELNHEDDWQGVG